MSRVSGSVQRGRSFSGELLMITSDPRHATIDDSLLLLFSIRGLIQVINERVGNFSSLSLQLDPYYIGNECDYVSVNQSS